MKLSIIVAAHNEGRYIRRCLDAIERATEAMDHEVIVICDRCTDRTVDEAKRFSARIMEKDRARWRNSYAENLEIGLGEAHGEYVAVVDADICVEPEYFRKAIAILNGDIASVSGRVVTEPSTAFNRLYSLWEKTYDVLGAGRARRQLHVPFWRTLLHSTVRLRPFVIIGYITAKGE